MIGLRHACRVRLLSCSAGTRITCAPDHGTVERISGRKGRRAGRAGEQAGRDPATVEAPHTGQAGRRR